MKILVSACLMGQNCKYNGGNNYSEKVMEFVTGHEVIAVCPESLGGLPIPRVPSEIKDGTVINREGVSVDKEFREGAAKALKIALDNDVGLAILQSRSPSCGTKEVYDGTFSGTKIPGKGIFAQLLSEAGIKVVEPNDL